jgi:hypothetical protein
MSNTRISGIIIAPKMSFSLNFSVSNVYPLIYLRGGMLISLMLEGMHALYLPLKKQIHRKQLANCSGNIRNTLSVKNKRKG